MKKLSILFSTLFVLLISTTSFAGIHKAKSTLYIKEKDLYYGFVINYSKNRQEFKVLSEDESKTLWHARALFTEREVTKNNKRKSLKKPLYGKDIWDCHAPHVLPLYLKPGKYVFMTRTIDETRKPISEWEKFKVTLTKKMLKNYDGPFVIEIHE